MILTRNTFVAAVTLISLAGLAHAQWTTVGSNIYYSAGNVGVGTSNPIFPVDARGSGPRVISAYNTTPTGYVYGMVGNIISNAGTGVWGFSGAPVGTGYGVYGLSNSDKGNGVVGYAAANSGRITTGVWGRARSSAGIGVWGLAENTGGTTYGLFGESRSPDGYALYAINRATSGAAYGVYGKSMGTAGAGVFGNGPTGPGVIGTTDATNGGDSAGATSAAGVRGVVTSTSPGSYSAGVWGINNSTTGNGIGVAGYHAGSGFGVYGKVADANGWAAWFEGGRNYFEGNVGIGDSEPNYTLEVNGDLKIGTGDRLYFGDNGENSNTLFLSRRNVSADRVDLYVELGPEGSDASTDYLAIAGSGGTANIFLGNDGEAYKTTSTTWTVFSDRRIKRDITTLQGSLDSLLQLRGVSFRFNELALSGDTETLQRGFIAQEVEQVFPEWVSDTEGFSAQVDGLKAVSISGFEALTVEALRELRAEKDAQLAERDSTITSIREEASSLRAENADLRDRLDQLEAMVQQLAAQSNN